MYYVGNLSNFIIIYNKVSHIIISANTDILTEHYSLYDMETNLFGYFSSKNIDDVILLLVV